jgi:protease IV
LHPGNNSQREPENETRENGGSGAARTVRRRRWPFVVGGLVALGLLVLTVGLVAFVLTIGSGGGGGPAASPVVYEEEYVSGEGLDKIAVIPIEGQIASADSAVPGTQPPVTPEGLADALRQAAEDERVAAVVLEVNSPGGGVTASDVMHQSILDFKERTGKPVVVSMGDVAASGGYYISTAADRIVANETTLTGSLGVFIPLLNFSEAADKYGVTQEYIKSGKFKTMGNAWDELTPEERKIFQSIVQDDYEEFVEVIVEGRELSEERVREIADGRIYSGQQAKEIGLVDEFGGLDEAVRASRRLADIQEATVVRYVQTPTLTERLFARLAPQEPEAARIIEEAGLDLEAKPYYLYLP